MATISVLDPNGSALSERVFQRLTVAPGITAISRITTHHPDRLAASAGSGTLVYFPQRSADTLQIPDPTDAAACLAQTASSSIRHLIVVSSAEVYGSRVHNPGLIPESQSLTYGHTNAIALGWSVFETAVTEVVAAWPEMALTILRPAAILVAGGTDYFTGLLSGRVAFTLVGHDPTLQWLHPDDLAGAIAKAALDPYPGVYNVAPSQVMTLRTTLRLAAVTRFPTPRLPQRLFRWLMPRSLIHPIDRVEYIRYSWTVCGDLLRKQLGYTPQKSSVDAVCDFLIDLHPNRRERILARCRTLPEEFDDFGLDKPYLASYSRTMFRFFADFYWRIEFRGMERIPKEGRAMLAGVHRGFMPLDGVATNYLIHRETGRYCRFLIHPTLIKFPFQFNFMTKIGGIIACQQNADYVLNHDGVVGFYPEGIQGAFRYIKGAYRLGKFGHNEFIRMALRNRAPIVPFVTVGHAEIFPIIAKIKWRRWMRFTLWPAFPIAPPFPLLSIPLPTKWHIQFLEPLHIERDYPPEAESDPQIVNAISQEIRSRMQTAIDELLSRRKHLFWGSLFKE